MLCETGKRYCSSRTSAPDLKSNPQQPLTGVRSPTADPQPLPCPALGTKICHTPARGAASYVRLCLNTVAGRRINYNLGAAFPCTCIFKC